VESPDTEQRGKRMNGIPCLFTAFLPFMPIPALRWVWARMRKKGTNGLEPMNKGEQ